MGGEIIKLPLSRSIVMREELIGRWQKHVRDAYGQIEQAKKPNNIAHCRGEQGIANAYAYVQL